MVKNYSIVLTAMISSLVVLCVVQLKAQGPYAKGNLIYENCLSSARDLQNWVMEGPGKTEFNDEWMEIYSPGQEWHHVLWCPVDFPESFIAEWDTQNLNPEAGVLVVFFAATGLHGEDIFDPSLPARNGTFEQYTKGRIRNYHVSHYTRNPEEPERIKTHLRKNNMFKKVQEGPEGIPKQSTAVHHITLVKQGNHILFYVDDRKVIDWEDDGKAYGPVYDSGKIGFRQMRWSRFRYRNFKVWSL